MKKFLLTVLCALFCLCGMAQSEKVYTEPLVVTINGESTEPQDASVTVVDNGNGTINFVLNNFVLNLGGEEMGVGNIELNDLEVKESVFGMKYFNYDDLLTIVEGNKEGVDTWMGPMLGEIPLVLAGKMNENNLYVTIDIDMQATLGQIIYVKLGANDLIKEEIYTEYGDGDVTIADGVAVLNAMAGQEVPGKADVNDDGDITIADFVAVLNLMAGQ